jgi:hypothetical protein
VLRWQGTAGWVGWGGRATQPATGGGLQALRNLVWLKYQGPDMEPRAAELGTAPLAQGPEARRQHPAEPFQELPEEK